VKADVLQHRRAELGVVVLDIVLDEQSGQGANINLDVLGRGEDVQQAEQELWEETQVAKFLVKWGKREQRGM
jgi:hypothetical protein